EYTCVCDEGWTGATCDEPDGPVVYDCVNNNPCTPENAVNGDFLFTAADPAQYVQCTEWGQCFEMDCAEGALWDQEALECVPNVPATCPCADMQYWIDAWSLTPIACNTYENWGSATLQVNVPDANSDYGFGGLYVADFNGFVCGYEVFPVGESTVLDADEFATCRADLVAFAANNNVACVSY
ncbi:chitin-binding domain-containing protein, partial [Enhygromyxa salina]|uniref:chitin-binding domain-containing protein n=1 Tax=Enhygromyxa salina TaxID=215803 RepID=UPI0013FD07DD